MRVDAAAEVVVEEAVAAGGDRRGGDRAVGGLGEGEPGRRGFEDAIEIAGAEEVALAGAGASHRLLVRLEEAGALGGRGLRTGDEPGRVALAAVPVDLVAVAGALLGRKGRVGDLDDVALVGAGERRR